MQASAAKSVFLSRMSHDIRTLLNGIIGYLNIEDYRKATPEVMKEDRKKSGWLDHSITVRMENAGKEGNKVLYRWTVADTGIGMKDSDHCPDGKCIS